MAFDNILSPSIFPALYAAISSIEIGFYLILFVKNPSHLSNMWEKINDLHAKFACFYGINLHIPFFCCTFALDLAYYSMRLVYH